MTDEPTPCAYCGHPPVHHAGTRCWTEVPAFGGGWRNCSCVAYAPEESA